MVRERLSDARRSPILPRSALNTLAPRKEDAVAEAKLSKTAC